MEILNLLGLFFFFYFIHSISFLNKILLFISLCSLTNCYIKRFELSKSSNIIACSIGNIICFGDKIFDIFYNLVKKIENTNIYKLFYNMLLQLNNYYIEGRGYLIGKVKSKIDNMIERKNKNPNKTFKNDNDMFDFLNELDSELDDKEKKNI